MINPNTPRHVRMINQITDRMAEARRDRMMAPEEAERRYQKLVDAWGRYYRAARGLPEEDNSK